MIKLRDDRVHQLCLENIGLAKHIARRVCRRFSFHDEDLIISAAFEGLVRSAERFDAEKGKFSTFAGNMIQWKCSIEIKSYRKRQMRRLYGIGRDGEEKSIEPPARSDSTREVAELLAAVKQLKPSYKILIDQLLHGDTISEIARTRNVSAQAIWEQYRRAVRDLGRIMEEN